MSWRCLGSLASGRNGYGEATQFPANVSPLLRLSLELCLNGMSCWDTTFDV